MAKETKQDVVRDIASLIGIEAPPMSTGSTEPREIFVRINECLGLGLEPRLGKPEMARAIAESAGVPWTPTCESRGATVTLEGLQRVRAATGFFLGQPLPQEYI